MPVSHIGHTVPLCGDSRLELVLQQQELPHAHIETFPPKSPLALWNHRLSHSLYDSSHRSRYLIKNPDYRRINQIAPFSLFTPIKTKILPHCYINRFSHIDSNIKIDFIVYNDRNLYSNLQFVRLIYQIQISNETNVEIGGANPIRCNDAESICPNR